MVEGTNVSLYLNNTQQIGLSQQKSLGKDDFLKLLVTQLSNQNPLEPMKNKDFMSQMATFSSLEQMKNMNDSLSNFLDTQSVSMQLQNLQLIGKHISWQKITQTEEGDVKTELAEGTIQSVHFKNGTIQFETKDGTMIGKGQIVSVGLPQEDEGGE